MNRISDFTYGYRTSSTSTLVYNDRVRLAGFFIVGRTASAGNKPHIKIIDGTSTAGTVILNISASSNYYTEEYYPWPLESLSRLFLEVSGSATGMAGLRVFYVPEVEL